MSNFNLNDPLSTSLSPTLTPIFSPFGSSPNPLDLSITNPMNKSAITNPPFHHVNIPGFPGS